MQLNIDTTVRTLSALVAGLPEDKRPAARVLAYAAVVVAFDAADALDDMIALDLDGLESAIDAEVDRAQVTATRRDAYIAYAANLADAEHAFGALNALWMGGRSKDGSPRKSPLNRGQFTGSGMPTTAEVDAVLAEYTA